MTRAYMRQSDGCSSIRMRLKLPSLKLRVCVAHGVVDEDTSSSTSSPTRTRVPTGRSDHSMPLVVRFSPAPARLDGVTFRLQALDDLHAEQAHRAMRPAMDRVLAVRVAVEAEPAHPGTVDRSLGHATAADVDLQGLDLWPVCAPTIASACSRFGHG